MRKAKLFLTAMGATMVMMGGCAAKVPPPLDEISNAKIALVHAKESEAPRYAPDELEAAEAHFAQIKSLMEKKEHAKAKQAAQKAHVEAQLAYTKAQNAKLKSRVQSLNGEVNTLKNEFTTVEESRSDEK